MDDPLDIFYAAMGAIAGFGLFLSIGGYALFRWADGPRRRRMRGLD